MALAGVAAFAQTAIQSVTGSVQGGIEYVKIELSQPLSAVPTGFAVQSPARIALDFPDTKSNLPRSAIEINQGNLKSVSVVQAGDRARVVLNLKQPTSYKAEIQGNSLLVALDPVTLGNTASAPGATFAESGTSDTQPIKDIDFRRGADNAGRVVIDLQNNQVGVDLRQQGQTLVVEFLKSSLPQGLRRRLDVSDFGTPIQSVTTFQTGDRVRMVIEPKGQWVHSAYQRDDQFVVEVREQKIDPTRLTQGPNYSGEKLSLNFQNIEVRSLLQVIADFTNFNIVTSDTVAGALTLRLKDVPWDQALQIIMDAKGLGMRKQGNVLWIAPKDELQAREQKDLEAAKAAEGLEPVRTQIFQMNYAKAASIADQLNGKSGGGGGGTAGGPQASFLSERGIAVAEVRTNQLFVSDIPSKLTQVQDLIAKLDIPVRQVLIEARIVEAADTFGRSLGVRLGATDQRAQRGGDGGYGIGGNNRAVWATGYNNATASSGASGFSADPNGTFVSLPAQALGSFLEPASFAVSIFSAMANRFLNLEISAAESDGKVKVVSSPRVVTADQIKALIEQGKELPYQTISLQGTQTMFRKANLKLEVVPQITPEGNIILDLDINKDTKGELTPAGFAINTKHIKTNVLVENGGTVVIGGIFTLDESEDVTQVPLLGDIPVVGNLFKTRTRRSDRQELLVFITPKMITDRATVR
ncbi:MAG: type IV pilus secretin PilQ [Burkholderiales bacterium]